MAPKRANLAVAFVLCFAMVWRMAAWKGKGTGPALYASGAHSSSSLLAVNETNATRELADVVHRVASAVSAASMIQGTAKLADESQDGAVETGKAIDFDTLFFYAITGPAHKFNDEKAWDKSFTHKLFEVNPTGDPQHPLVDEKHFLAAFAKKGTFGSVVKLGDKEHLLTPAGLKLVFEKLWEKGRKLVTDQDRPEQTRVLHYDCTKSFFSGRSSFLFNHALQLHGFPVDVGVWKKFLARDYPSNDGQCLDVHGKYIDGTRIEVPREVYDGISCYSTYESTGAAPQERHARPSTPMDPMEEAARMAAHYGDAKF